MTDLKIVPIVEGKDPLVGSLHNHIEELIYNYCADKEITLAEIVGTLEFVKQDFIKTQHDEL